jgi:hypothetical protein
MKYIISLKNNEGIPGFCCVVKVQGGNTEIVYKDKTMRGLARQIAKSPYADSLESSKFFELGGAELNKNEKRAFIHSVNAFKQTVYYG